MIRQTLLAVTLFFVGISSAYAQGGGGFSIGGNLGIATANQRHLKDLQEEANSRESGLSVPTLGNAWEANLMFTYRMSGMFALQLRPGFFYNQEEDTNSAGDKFTYSAVGWTIFPVLRTYMLESNAIKLFANFSVGWGMMFAEVNEATKSLEFSGNNLGYLAGLGVEFCFFGSSHCMNIEGNIRQLSIERMTTDSSSGDWDGADGSIDQGNTSGEEVEFRGRDLGTSMSGIVGLLGYIYYF